MTDSLFQSLGKMKLPTTAADVDATAKTLAPLDPARDVLLDCLRDAINFELNPAWAVAVVGVAPLAGNPPVADTWPGVPNGKTVLQRAMGFPCLFLARDGVGKISDYSLARRQLTQAWGLHYIIAPIDVGDERKICDILVRVGGVILATIERGGHAAYSGGQTAFRGLGLNTLFLRTMQAGRAKFADDDAAPLYHALSCELESTEIMKPVEGTGTDFNGARMELGTGNAEGVIQPLVNLDTSVPLQGFQPIGALGIGRTYP